jgi:DNA-binding MarR family transcriptional regulator
VTSQGRRTRARASRAVQRTEEEFLAPLSERERIQLKKTLRGLITA